MAEEGSKKSSQESTGEEGSGKESGVLRPVERGTQNRRSVQVLRVRTGRVSRRDLRLRGEV